MNLIKASQKTAFFKAIKNVTDTFFQREAIFRQYPLGFDDFGRLIKDPITSQPQRLDRTFPCSIESRTDLKAKIEYTDRGLEENFDFMVNINAQDAVTAGIVDAAGNWLINDEDVFIFDEKFHQMVLKDSIPFQDVNVLISFKVLRMPDNGDW
jgi:hypothetical protein